ncbi:hypothetical protein [Acetobacter thailandicus]|uniref:hypothetical protein n=1 Tax=Acetobacter thailandicus TaxID=1502842 RepID=UPI001BA5ED80|nr:hypothetical protein [Acetobacter thailandicus]MBS0960270.1 hypothetical protein [Acetobacter thailandicus]
MDSNYVTNMERLNGIMWHLECIALARKEIEKFRPPADLFRIRVYYSLYVTNLMSVIDFILEIYKGDFQEALEKQLKTSHHSGEDVLGYVRELRNGIVHRGLDPTAGALVKSGIVYVVAKPVTNRSGAKIYSAPALFLRDILLHTDISARPVIERFLERTFEEIVSIPLEEIIEIYSKIIEKTAHMPEWAKKISHSNTPKETLEIAIRYQISKCRELLQPPMGQRII